MRFGEAFGGLLPGARGEVLAVLLRTGVPLTGRQVHALLSAQFSLWSVQQALAALVGLGVVESQTVGRAMIHSINEDHYAIGPLRVLLDPVAALRDTVRGAVASVSAVVLFGSVARREAMADSDIDLVVLAPPDWDDRAELQDVIRARIGNDCDVLKFTPAEFARPAASGDEPVVAAIHADGGVHLGSLPQATAGVAQGQRSTWPSPRRSSGMRAGAFDPRSPPGLAVLVLELEKRREVSQAVSFWNNIARSTVRELAKAAGLRSSNQQAVEDLETKYGTLPTAEFVDQMWPVLRDGWLTRSAPHRQTVVARMRELGRGDMSLRVKTRSEQLAYLHSLRRSPALANAVLEVFLASGSQDRPPPVFVEPPASPEEQEARFNTLVRDRLLKLDAATISGFERSMFSAIESALEGLTFPVAEPKEFAKRITGAVASTFLIPDDPELADVEPHPYQRVILDRLAARLPDTSVVPGILRYFAG